MTVLSSQQTQFLKILLRGKLCSVPCVLWCQLAVPAALGHCLGMGTQDLGHLYLCQATAFRSSLTPPAGTKEWQSAHSDGRNCAAWWAVLIDLPGCTSFPCLRTFCSYASKSVTQGFSGWCLNTFFVGICWYIELSHYLKMIFIETWWSSSAKSWAR